MDLGEEDWLEESKEGFDPYPTEAALTRIRDWKIETLEGGWALADFVESLWWPNYGTNPKQPPGGWRGWHRTGDHGLSISTGGWSGNEELVGAMQANTMFWTLYAESWRVGGHYTFDMRVSHP
jgi:hypothetical protein